MPGVPVRCSVPLKQPCRRQSGVLERRLDFRKIAGKSGLVRSQPETRAVPGRLDLAGNADQFQRIGIGDLQPTPLARTPASPWSLPKQPALNLIWRLWNTATP